MSKSELGTLNRQTDADHSPLPCPAAQAHLAAVPVNDSARQRQPQATARNSTRGRAPIKFLPDIGKFLFGNSGTCVSHFHHHGISILKCAHLNGLTGTSELQGIVNQVMDDEQEQIGIAGNKGKRPGSLWD